MAAVRKRMKILLSLLRGGTSVALDDDGSEEVRFAIILNTTSEPSISMVTTRDDYGVLRASLRVENIPDMFDFSFSSCISHDQLPSRDGAGALTLAERMSKMLGRTLPDMSAAMAPHISAIGEEGRLQMLAAYARDDLATWTMATQGGVSIRSPSPWMEPAVLLRDDSPNLAEYAPADHGRLRRVLPGIVSVRNDPYKRQVTFEPHRADVLIETGGDPIPDTIEVMRAVATIGGKTA